MRKSARLSAALALAAALICLCACGGTAGMGGGGPRTVPQGSPAGIGDSTDGSSGDIKGAYGDGGREKKPVLSGDSAASVNGHAAGKAAEAPGTASGGSAAEQDWKPGDGLPEVGDPIEGFLRASLPNPVGIRLRNGSSVFEMDQEIDGSQGLMVRISGDTGDGRANGEIYAIGGRVYVRVCDDDGVTVYAGKDESGGHEMDTFGSSIPIRDGHVTSVSSEGLDGESFVVITGDDSFYSETDYFIDASGRIRYARLHKMSTGAPIMMEITEPDRIRVPEWADGAEERGSDAIGAALSYVMYMGLGNGW